MKKNTRLTFNTCMIACMHRCRHTHTPRHVNMYTHKCTYVHALIHKHTHINMYILVPAHTISIYIHVYMHTQEPASLYTCSHIPAHTHAHARQVEKPSISSVCLPPCPGKTSVMQVTLQPKAQQRPSTPCLSCQAGKAT